MNEIDLRIDYEFHSKQDQFWKPVLDKNGIKLSLHVYKQLDIRWMFCKIELILEGSYLLSQVISAVSATVKLKKFQLYDDEVRLTWDNQMKLKLLSSPSPHKNVQYVYSLNKTRQMPKAKEFFDKRLLFTTSVMTERL